MEILKIIPSYIVPKNYTLRIMRKNGRKIWTYIHPNNKKKLIYVFTIPEEETTIYGQPKLYILIPNGRNFVYYFIPPKHLWFYKTNLLIRG